MPKIELTEEVLKEIERQVTINVLEKLGIKDGLHTGFQSVGIQDSATQCQVTILDNATVIENGIVTTEVTIKGDLTVEGNLKLLGEMPTDSPFYRDLVEHSAGILKLAMDGQFFLAYVDRVMEKIKSDGLDITNSRFNGPMSLNDEECSLSIGKMRDNFYSIKTNKPQALVLGANGKNNLVLEPDGAVSIERMSVGAIQIGSSNEQPKHDAEKGSVMFNEEADYGKPVGWVSLGKTKWVPFGVIN